MSRGPGALQRDVLEVLGSAGGSLCWRELKRRFPLEVEHRTFYRAVRSLRRVGRIRLVEASPGGRLHVLKMPRRRMGERVAIAGEELRELLAGEAIEHVHGGDLGDHRGGYQGGHREGAEILYGPR